MAFKYSIPIAAIVICMSTFRASALPIRLERQASGMRESKSTLKSALIALRDIANHRLPRKVLRFYSTCRLLDDAKVFTEMNNTEIENTATLEILLTVKSIRNITCNLLYQISEWNLLNEDGSCSNSALNQLCTKIMLVHDTDSAQRLLNVPYNECTWLHEVLGEDPDVPQQIKDTIREKIACPPKS